MRASQPYVNLVIQHARLHLHLLPKSFDVTGNYPEQVITHTLAYRLLTHAEIESYLEDRVLETAQKAMTAWQDKKKVSKTLLGLLAFSGQDVESPPKAVDLSKPEQASSWTDRIQLTNRIQRAMDVFCHAVKENHGVKSNNIHQLLLPIGIEVNEIENDLVADLNSYGEQRGQVAHLSSLKYRATQQIDPKTELNKVKSIIARLIKIDQAIDKRILEISN